MPAPKSVLRAIAIAPIALLLVSCGSSGPQTLKLMSAADSRNAAGEGAPTTDAMYKIWNVEYKIVGDLPDLGDSASSWSMRALRKSDMLTTFRNVAAELSVEGPIVASPDGSPSYSIGSTDRTGHGMWLWWGEREAWWTFTSEDNASDVVRSCTTSPDGGEDCVESKPVMSQPTNLPSRTAAESRVRQVITAAGEDPAGFELRTTIDSWGAYVQASRKFGDVPSSFTWWFTLGEGGDILYASGQIIDPERGEVYPLIEPSVALKRLATPFYSMERGDAVPAVAEDAATGGSDTTSVPVVPGETIPPDTAPGSSVSETTTTVAETTTTVAPSSTVSPSSTVLPSTIVPTSTVPSTTTTIPDVETTVVTVTGVRLTLMPAYLIDGGLVALPAYTFTNDDGDVGTVFAIEGKYLEFPDPAVLDDADSTKPSGGSEGGSGGEPESSGDDHPFAASRRRL